MKAELINFYTSFKIFIFPVVVTLSLLILIVFIIYPQIVKLISNQTAQVEFRKKSALLEAKASVLEQLDEGELKDNVEALLIAYPLERDFSEILGILQGIANQKGFSVSEITVQQTVKTYGNAQSFSLKLEATGPKRLLAEFINTVESSVRIMKISSIDVTPVPGIEIVDIILAIDVFFAPYPQTFGSIDSPLPQLSKEDEEFITTLARSAIGVPRITPSGPRGKANPFE